MYIKISKKSLRGHPVRHKDQLETPLEARH